MRASTSRLFVTGAAVRPASISARGRRSPISARRSRSCSASARCAHGTSFLGEILGEVHPDRGGAVSLTVRLTAHDQHPRTARGARAPDPGAAGGEERRLARAGCGRRAGGSDPARVSARPRSRHPLQGVPAPEAQDPGVLRADRRSLPHAADAHARGVADRPEHRQGAAAERGADRGDRARPRSRATRRSATPASACSTISSPAASTTTSRASASSTCSRTTAPG